MKRLLSIFRDDLPGFLLLGLLLTSVAGAIAVADWTSGLWSLLGITLLALIAGYLLAISSFRESIMLLFAVAYGAFFVWAIVGAQLPEDFTFRQRTVELGIRAGAWLRQAAAGGFSNDTIIFVLLLGFVFWFLGFNAAANVFRTQHTWLAVIPPGLVMLINNFYYFGDARVDLLLVAYMFLSFMMAVRTNSMLRERIWRYRRMTFTPGIRFDLLRGGFIAAVIVLVVAWSAPAVSASNRLASAWDRSVNPWHRFQDTFNRLFGGVEGGAAVTADYYGGTFLTMGGPVNLGNQTVMYVYAPEGYHYYWRSKLFDSYSNGRWVSSADLRIRSEFGVLNSEEEANYLQRTTIQQRFEIAIPATQLVYAAPEPVSFASLPIVFDVNFTQPGTENAIVSVVRAEEPIRSGEGYTATSSVSFADENSLRSAGVNYPQWVQEYYLKVPDTVTDRTRELAADLVAPHDNPYDAARAIERYLRENISYNEQVAPVPRGEEPVDYVLFTSREGYCNYYASTMAVMLRTQGIPARVAAGFLRGDRDDTLGAYRVLESDAHSWVEVYFPRFGWIEFEPTSAEEAIVRAEGAASTVGDAEILRDELQPDGGLVDELDNGQLPDGGLPGEDEAVTPPLVQAVRNFRIPGWVRWIFTLLAVAVASGAAVWFWFEQRGMGGLSGVSKSYARLNIFAPWIGVRLEPSATPRERSMRIAGRLPENQGDIQRIADLFVQEQYARPSELPTQADKDNSLAGEAWGRLRRTFVVAALLNWLERINPLRGAVARFRD